ncbi:hypothetical protein ACLOJK_021189 [Asimina triloba]
MNNWEDQVLFPSSTSVHVAGVKQETSESSHALGLGHEEFQACNSTVTGASVKKAKVQSSSAQSTFKVKKEKLGDRITALHQLVSPFGKGLIEAAGSELAVPGKCFREHVTPCK